MAKTEIKPIQTAYNGYLFRSRTEARWARFFDALGIEYRYELDGFDLDGIRYLPDFWLPDQQCWVEIKGQEPTEQEIEKADLLSVYTQKPVHIFWGDVWIPGRGTKSALSIYRFHILGYCSDCSEAHCREEAREKLRDEAEKAGKVICEEDLGSIRETEFDCHLDSRVQVPPHIMALFYKLGKQNVALRVVNGHLHLDVPIKSVSKDILSLVETYESDLIELLSYHDGWLWALDDQVARETGMWWCECPMCRTCGVEYEGWSYLMRCKCQIEDDPKSGLKGDRAHTFPGYYHSFPAEQFYTYKSPRLVAAYTAARQERFDHRR